MKKNVVQDVIPPKKSIRNVELPSRARNFQATKIKEEKVEETKEREPSAPRHVSMKIQESQAATPPAPLVQPEPAYTFEYKEPPKKRSRKVFYIGGSVVLLVGAFVVSAFFRSAEIRVTPKTDVKTVSDNFTARKDSTGNNLGFQLVTNTKSVQKTVEASGEQKVEKKARGNIVIYNNTAESQKLVATTRFETPEGLIFRLVSPATVPAKQTKDGKSVAGSIEVTVEADKVGTSYNVGMKDFTIPGFKGDPKYTTVYARSKTEMTGGFSGVQKVVSKAVIDQTDKELEAQLKSDLAGDIASQIPANFILYTPGLSYKFEITNQISDTASGAVLQKKATITGIIFDRGSLNRAILGKIMPGENADAVKITNLEELDFTMSSSSSAFDPNSSGTLNFTLKGNANLVWVFDENQLKADLLGLSKNESRIVLGKYDTIKEAWVETSPFWNQNIPKDPESVTLVNTLTK